MFRYKVYRSAVIGGTYGPTKIAEFMNQVDAEIFARAETMRATAEAEDVSIDVRLNRRSVGEYHSALARQRLDLPPIRVTIPTVERELRALGIDASADTDNEGQVLLYTGMEDSSVGLVPQGT